jgi:hypothetical protein
MPADTRRLTGFAHVRGASGEFAALCACIGSPNRQTLASVESRLHGRGSSIIFPACDLPVTASTGSMRDQIEAPHLLNRYAEVVGDNVAACRFEDGGRT